MIIGIGLDVIEVSRFGHGAHPRLEARILTPRERRNLSANGGRRSEYVAGRFAVKEAVAKAAGCGIGQLIGWQDIEVLPDDAGRPTVMLARLEGCSYSRQHYTFAKLSGRAGDR